jgi:hypothetical protein
VQHFAGDDGVAHRRDGQIATADAACLGRRFEPGPLTPVSFKTTSITSNSVSRPASRSRAAIHAGVIALDMLRAEGDIART